ncbi:hypothetical protein ABA45_10985 [Marinobacter psychrophilus]|jgi:hypothetical protein|uniref:DUF1523 family protein n=1 Tax=Marinobacter psychrophilus TaxID=330734 RepID=A0A0H4I1N7_9GAMM|nr:DUF1523 family protein [Marinobacter psychrophilus]AKO52859.1 hypothetical protein ABA45_10985 [Marinobacter psychrophilus]
MKKLKIILIGCCLIVMGLALHYVLPRVSVVEVVGVEVKRTDVEVGTRDVYMIQTRLIGSDNVRVFRNEDAWLYFKINSANLQTQAAVFAREENGTAVAVRHYGWRLPLFSMFPNATSAWPVEPGYRHIPIFNIVILVFLLGLAFIARRVFKRASGKLTELRARHTPGRADNVPSSSPSSSSKSSPASDAGHDEWLQSDQQTSSRSDKSGRDD